MYCYLAASNRSEVFFNIFEEFFLYLWYELSSNDQRVSSSGTYKKRIKVVFYTERNNTHLSFTTQPHKYMLQGIKYSITATVQKLKSKNWPVALKPRRV